MPAIRVRAVGWAVFAAALAAAGCGPPPPTLRGEVTLDGAPVDGGGIMFFPDGEGGRGASAPVVGGKYEIPPEFAPTTGKFRVEVRWPKKTGRELKSDDPGIKSDELREAVPEKYNTKTTLAAEIGPGENVKDFHLTSK